MSLTEDIERKRKKLIQGYKRIGLDLLMAEWENQDLSGKPCQFAYRKPNEDPKIRKGFFIKIDDGDNFMLIEDQGQIKRFKIDRVLSFYIGY